MRPEKEVEVAGQWYRVGRLGAITQFHVARRLLPVATAIGETWQALQRAGVKSAADLYDKPGVLEAAEPMTRILARMPDADGEYIINTCLDCCKRKVGDAAWQRLRAQGGGMVFEDVDLPAMMQIVAHVLMENLGPFFPGLAGQSSGAASQQA